MMNDSCPWTLFDEQEGHAVADQLHFVGGFSSVIFLWLLLAYWDPSIQTNWSYQNIGFFMLSAWLRRTAPFIMSFITDRNDASFSREEKYSCQLFGFLETFMAIHEVECLTHVCVERYVAAKYITNGWQMPKYHYYLFRALSVVFAAGYSVSAFIAWGGFGFDFTCKSCTMDMMMPDGLDNYFAMGIFVLRSIKPAAFMIYMLLCAVELEGKFPENAYTRKQCEITKTVIVLTVVNLTCWAPIALIRASAILSPGLYSDGFLPAPPFFVKAALLLHWSSLACSTIAMFLLSPEIRKAAINFRFRRLSDITPRTQKME